MDIEKFNLYDNDYGSAKIPNQPRHKRVCFFHPDILAITECPVCHKSICESCKVILDERNGKEKFVCKSCKRKYLFKLFVSAILIFLFILTYTLRTIGILFYHQC